MIFFRFFSGGGDFNLVLKKKQKTVDRQPELVRAWVSIGKYFSRHGDAAVEGEISQR